MIIENNTPVVLKPINLSPIGTIKNKRISTWFIRENSDHDNAYCQIFRVLPKHYWINKEDLLSSLTQKCWLVKRNSFCLGEFKGKFHHKNCLKKGFQHSGLVDRLKCYECDGTKNKEYNDKFNTNNNVKARTCSSASGDYKFFRCYVSISHEYIRIYVSGLDAKIVVYFGNDSNAKCINIFSPPFSQSTLLSNVLQIIW